MKLIKIQAKKFKDTIAARERAYVSEADNLTDTKKTPIMLIGDRGTGVGSSIKGYCKYGGKWKPKLHGRYAASCITNEYKSSQLCAYCFKKIVHPKKEKMIRGVMKKIDSNGSSVCINPECITVQVEQAVQSRDKQSALLICLAGVSHLINGSTYPELNPQLSHSNTEQPTAPLPSSARSGGRAPSL